MPYNSLNEGRHFKIDAFGKSEPVIEIAQAFSWLSAVFRLPEYGKIMYSDLNIEIVADGMLGFSLPPLEPVLEEEMCCWHPLFANSVIARGFPIPPRTDQEGLEIDFNIMANLAATLYPLQCHGGLVMKGLSSVLIPKKQTGDSIQWHLVLGPLDEKLSMAKVEVDMSQFYETQNLRQLVEARAFLGLYENAQVHLGTNGSGYRNLNYSHATREKSKFQLYEMSATMGSSISSMWNFTVGTKFSKQKGLRVVENMSKVLLERRLKNSQSQPLLMYDVGDQRGWLIPEISALLHITQACLSRDDDLMDILDSMPHAQEDIDGEAAFSAIHAGKEFEVRRAEQSLTGQPQYFTDFITQILTGFERRKEVVLTRDNKASVPVSVPFRRPTLYGWEVEDLITGSMFYDRKEVKLNKSTAGDWFQISENRPELLVLFCKGLGEPIKPSPSTPHCRAWDPIPVDQGYLVATVRCLEQLSKLYGNDSSKSYSFQLAEGLYWH